MDIAMDIAMRIAMDIAMRIAMDIAKRGEGSGADEGQVQCGGAVCR